MNEKGVEMIIEKFTRLVYAVLITFFLVLFGMGSLFAYYIYKSYEDTTTGYIRAEQSTETGDNLINQSIK